MLIVIEGPDGSGKSTLARRIKELAPSTEVRHFGPPQQHPLLEYVQAVGDYMPGVQDVVFDRLHWGELVYGPIYRGATQLGPAGLAAINKYLSEVGAVLVLAYAQPRELRTRIAERGDDYVRPADLSALYSSYRTVWQQSLQHGLTIIPFDTTAAHGHATLSTDDMAHHLIDVASALEEKVVARKGKQ